MDIFRDLHISADPERMAAAADQIERSLPAGWTRDRSAEERARSAPALKPRPTYCFSCSQEGRRPAAMVILTQKDPATFSVTNIMPLARHQLSHGEYNGVLEEFYERLLRPPAERAGLTTSLSEARAGLDHWMSPEVAEKLCRFSSSANRGTGSAHPSDRERWNDFVLAAHRERSRLDAATLQRWLVEIDEWAPEVAEQLAVEYEYGRELLAFADGHRRSA